MSKRTMTRAEVASHLGVTLSTVDALVERGELKAWTLAGVTRIRTRDVDNHQPIEVRA